MVRRLLAHVVRTVGLLAILSSSAPVYAIGYWNMPGNVCQCWGCGWGAGHHACYMLGPPSCEGALAHNEVRLPYAPQPPCGYSYAGGNHYDFRAAPQAAPANYQAPAENLPPTIGESMPDLVPENLPMPEESGPSRALFDPPVEP